MRPLIAVLVMSALAGCGGAGTTPQPPPSAGGAGMVTVPAAHAGADRLVLGKDVLASGSIRESVVLTTRSGTPRATAKGWLVGVDDADRAVILQRDAGDFVLARLALDGTVTAFGRFAAPYQPEAPVESHRGDGEGPSAGLELEASDRRLRVTALALTGAPATIVVALARVDVNESWLLAFDSDGKPLMQQHRTGANGNYQVRGIIANPRAAEVGVLVLQGADRPSLAQPSALLMVDARTGAVRWQHELPGRLSAGDGAMSMDGRGGLVLYRSYELIRFTPDGAPQERVRSPGFGDVESLALSADGQRGAAVVRTIGHRDMGGGPGDCRTFLFELQGDSEPVTVRLGASDADCPPLGLVFDERGRLLAAP